MNSNLAMPQTRLVSHKRIFISMLTIFFLILIGVIYYHTLHKPNPETYVSITETHHDETLPEGNDLVVSLYTYFPSSGITQKRLDFPYTAQYSLGVVDLFDNCAFYSQDVDDCGDQIFRYDLSSKQTIQLTDDLYAVNYLIPTDKYLFFAACLQGSTNVCLGSYNKKSKKISYWGNDSDTNIECMCVNTDTKKVYLCTYSESEDRYNLQHQTNDDFVIADHSVWEIDFELHNYTKLFTVSNTWIRMLISNNSQLLYIADQKYNSANIPSVYTYYDLSTHKHSNMPAPPYRIERGDASFHSDGKSLFVLSKLPTDINRSLYIYNQESQSYSLIHKTADNAFINNYQVINP